MRIPLALMLALLASTAPAPVNAQAGNLREPFSSVGSKSIVRLPGTGECWILGGNADSLFGLSVDQDRRLGLLFTVKGGIPVTQVNVLVGLHDGFSEAAKPNWEFDFRNRGTTNSDKYMYQADITETQMDNLLSYSIVTFTALYQTERGLGHIGLAHMIDFSDSALTEFTRCVESMS